MKVDRYVEPSEFDQWKQIADDMGFAYVASGPLVRSSYKVSHLVSFVSDDSPYTQLLGRRILYREYVERKGHREQSEESRRTRSFYKLYTDDMIVSTTLSCYSLSNPRADPGYCHFLNDVIPIIVSIPYHCKRLRIIRLVWTASYQDDFQVIGTTYQMSSG